MSLMRMRYITYLFFTLMLICPTMTAATSLTICVPTENPPFAYYNKEKQLRGFDIEVLEKMELPYSLDIQSVDFPTALARLVNNTCDMTLTNISITPVREQRFLFSTPHIRSGVYALVMQNSPITALEELKNCTVGVLKGSTAENYAFQNLKSGIILALPSNRQLLQLLRDGKIDAFLQDKPLLQKISSLRKDTRILDPAVTTEVYAYGFPKQRAQLRDEVNEKINKLAKDGVIDILYSKWFGGDMDKDMDDAILEEK